MEIRTAAGQQVRMTPGHLLPAGSCHSGVELALREASEVAIGDCVNTLDGRQEVLSVSTSKVNFWYLIATFLSKIYFLLRERACTVL